LRLSSLSIEKSMKFAVSGTTLMQLQNFYQNFLLITTWISTPILFYRSSCPKRIVAQEYEQCSYLASNFHSLSIGIKIQSYCKTRFHM